MKRTLFSHYLHATMALLLGTLTALASPALASYGTTVIPAAGADAATAAESTNGGSNMLAAGTRFATPYYVNDSGKSGPTVWVVGGMHGNEKAGYLAARKFINVQPKRGRIVVIPEANKLGIAENARVGGHPGDLNRDFPKSSSGKPSSELAKSIWSLAQTYKPDYLFDLHEGYDFHRVNSKSVGQSLIYYPKGDAQSMAKAMQSAVNKTISKSSHRYSLLKNPVKGSLARAAGAYLGATSMILETSRKQPLDTRVNQHVTMVNAALKRLNMI